jgi:N-acetylglutamate synthase
MAISIRDLEEAAADGWRAPEEARLGDWRLRAAGGFTGRANSALAIGDPGLPLAGAIAEVVRWYQARGLPAMVSVAYPPGQPERSEVDWFLAGQDWPVRSVAATVMTAASPGPAATAGDGPAATAGDGQGQAAATDGQVHVDVDPEPDQAWLALYRFHGQRPPPICRQLLMSAPWQAFGSVREPGGTVAIGRVAAAGDWAGLTAVEVHPEHRRRGLGYAITAALAAAAVSRGVTGLYLQVENDNAAARALYRRAGFTDHHEYHYRVAPAGPARGS